MGRNSSLSLDDVYVICRPSRVLQVFRLLEHELGRKACICVHQAMTQIWNRGGVEPAGAATTHHSSRLEKPDAVVWRGGRSGSDCVGCTSGAG